MATAYTPNVYWKVDTQAYVNAPSFYTGGYSSKQQQRPTPPKFDGGEHV